MYSLTTVPRTNCSAETTLYHRRIDKHFIYRLGTLEIEPASGFFGNTTFTLTAAEGWDDDADDLPMMYQFGYYIQDSGKLREELLGTPIEANSLEVDLLPQGNAFEGCINQ